MKKENDVRNRVMKKIFQKNVQKKEKKLEKKKKRSRFVFDKIKNKIIKIIVSSSQLVTRNVVTVNYVNA